jgi:hypothetical protein
MRTIQIYLPECETEIYKREINSYYPYEIWINDNIKIIEEIVKDKNTALLNLQYHDGYDSTSELIRMICIEKLLNHKIIIKDKV